MADRVLRDHSELCEHGSFASRYAHKLHPTKEGYHFEMCPGGREVTDSDILTMAADIIETDPNVGAVFEAARKRKLAKWLLTNTGAGRWIGKSDG